MAEKKSRFDGGERGMSGEEETKNMSIDERGTTSSSMSSTAKEPTVESRIL